MKRATVEVDERDYAGLPLGERPARRGVTAHREHGGVGELSEDRVPGELGLGPHEIEARLLSHGAAAAVAPHEPPRAEALPAGAHDDSVLRALHFFDGATALDLDAHGERACREDPFEVLHLGAQLDIGWA